LTYTLVADGSSDQVLLPLLTWSLRQQGISPISPQMADRGRIPRYAEAADFYRAALELYPCDLLFVHRDAESQAPQARRIEIIDGLRGVAVRHVPVVPVRMTEAWLLWNESAIRFAAGNPNGTEPLSLPHPATLERLPDPKKLLHEAIERASGLNARRRSGLRTHQRVHRVAETIDDFTPLLAAPAFAQLQHDLRDALRQLATEAHA
jgi:hypothetical protein